MKEFLIFRTEKKSEKSPDYRLTAKIGEEFVDIGAGWSKTSKKGTKFISCLLSKPYQDKKGWEIRPERTDERVDEKDNSIKSEDITFEAQDDLI